MNDSPEPIVEDLDDPIGHVRRVKELMSAEYLKDPAKFWADMKLREEESRKSGIKFVDFSNEPPRKTGFQHSSPTIESDMLLREESPKLK